MAVCAGSSSTILRESRSYRLWSSGPTNPTTKQEKAAPSRQIITAELCGNEVALHELLSGWVICLHMLVYATHDFNHKTSPAVILKALRNKQKKTATK